MHLRYAWPRGGSDGPHPSDSSGKHQIKAKFVELSDGKVKLEREDGSNLAIDLEKLSEADQKYVAEQQAEENPFKPIPKKAVKRDEDDEEQPRPAKRKKSRAAEETEDDAGSESPAKFVKPNWSKAAMIPLMPSKEKWSFKVAPPTQSEESPRPRAIPLPAKVDFFEGAQGADGQCSLRPRRDRLHPGQARLAEPVAPGGLRHRARKTPHDRQGFGADGPGCLARQRVRSGHVQ